MPDKKVIPSVEVDPVFSGSIYSDHHQNIPASIFQNKSMDVVFKYLTAIAEKQPNTKEGLCISAGMLTPITEDQRKAYLNTVKESWNVVRDISDKSEKSKKRNQYLAENIPANVTRGNNNVVSINWIGLDLDDVTNHTLLEVIKLLRASNISYIYYLTFNDLSDQDKKLRRARLLLPFSREVTSDCDKNIRLIGEGLMSFFKSIPGMSSKNIKELEKCFDPARLFFAPRKKALDAVSGLRQENTGRCIDIDALMQLAPKKDPFSKGVSINPSADNVDQSIVKLEVEAALKDIDPNCDGDDGYNQWIKILSAIDQIFNDDDGARVGYELAREWSSRSDKYEGDDKFLAKWEKTMFKSHQSKGGDQYSDYDPISTIRKYWPEGKRKSWVKKLSDADKKKLVDNANSGRTGLYPKLTGLTPTNLDAQPWLDYFTAKSGQNITPMYKPSQFEGQLGSVMAYDGKTSCWYEVGDTHILEGAYATTQAGHVIRTNEKGDFVTYVHNSHPTAYKIHMSAPIISSGRIWKNALKGVVLGTDGALVWNPEFRTITSVKDNLHNLLQTHNYDIRINDYYETESNSSITWNKYISSMLEIKNNPVETKERVEFVQAFIGASLLGLTCDIQAPALWLQGVKGAGKSTLITVIRNIIGEDKNSTLTPHDLAERFRLIGVEGKRLISHTEVPSFKIQDTNILKSVIFGEEIYGEAKGIQGKTFKPEAAVIWASNKLPDVRDFDDATLDRMAVLHVAPKTWRGQDGEIRGLADILSNDRQKIILTCIKSFENIMKIYNRLELPKSVRAATLEWQKEADVATKWLLSHVRPGSTKKDAVRIGFVYDVFREHLKSEGVKDNFIPTKRNFEESIINTGLFDIQKVGNSPVLIFKEDRLASSDLLPGAILETDAFTDVLVTTRDKSPYELAQIRLMELEKELEEARKSLKKEEYNNSLNFNSTSEMINHFYKKD